MEPVAPSMLEAKRPKTIPRPPPMTPETTERTRQLLRTSSWAICSGLGTRSPPVELPAASSVGDGICDAMTSRICVKNLPKDVEEARLAKHFDAFGPFTDVKVMRTREGVSRGFAFIGFVDGGKAQEAIRHFDRSFMGTRRLSVEPARKVGDGALPRPWSKYSKGSSGYKALHPEEEEQESSQVRRQPSGDGKKTVESAKEEEEDEGLEEFLKLMMPTKKTEKWDEQVSSSKEKQQQNKRKRIQEENPDGAEEMDETGGDAESGISRLFVRNLPYGATESDLVEAFSSFGELTEVHLVLDSKTKKSKGFAFVEYESSSSAAQALSEMDGSILQGRLIHVLPSSKKRHNSNSTKPVTTPSDANSSFKREREAQQKAQAGNRVAWNTFYMRPDTITEAVADYYQVSKSDLMNRDASDLGVRLALGETYIISKTKEELESTGVDISKLEAAAEASGKAAGSKSIPRSDDCLIVKNLPYHSVEAELREMFGVFGTIVRFVMPATHVMAIIQFSEASAAREAFRSLAYKKYKTVPIYLEWAPQDLLKAQSTDLNAGDSSMEHLDGDEDEAGATLYVKNLSFSTRDQDLSRHFDSAASEVGGHLRSARVARKTHANGSIVSAGFGFVELNSDSVAKHVMKKMQNSILDGHTLQLRLSARKSDAPRDKGSQDDAATPNSKLIVKNLAFECTRNDVVSLFSPYGHVQSCRLPKKFDGQHRGFAFLQFVTKQEAKRAMERVNGAHLYGRRLNIAFAQDVEEEGPSLSTMPL